MSTALSPVEYVRSLSPADKEAVFVDLVREVIREYGDTGTIPLQTVDGKPFGFYIPQAVADRRGEDLRSVLAFEDKDVTSRALADLDNTFDGGKYLDDLSHEDATPG
jgi:hypothetical protein